MRAQLGYTSLGIIIFGLWEMWKHSCRLKFEGGELEPTMVIHNVLRQVQDMNTLCKPKRRPTRWEEILLEMLRVPIKHLVSKRGKWLAWEKPSRRSLKLNTDRSRKGAVAMGSVVRDSNGDFILGYVITCSHNEVLQAELDVIIRGLMLCRVHMVFSRRLKETQQRRST